MKLVNKFLPSFTQFAGFLGMFAATGAAMRTVVKFNVPVLSDAVRYVQRGISG